ncbi:MAG: GTP cyclohydrolase I FolE2 [Deltaproteobacteria bacterium]|nr:GTP cyclohydrolase I FolE2 [Deltaproteobacteria bacterium]
MTQLADIQNSRDERALPINKVGVKGLRYPIVVRDKAHGRQHTVGTFRMAVNLPGHFKGTHMSRFVEVLERHQSSISLREFRAMCAEIKQALTATEAHVAVEFPYFVEKTAPRSGAPGLVSYACSIEASLNHEFDMVLGIVIPVQTLCPCSKELAKVSAHTQRGEITVKVRFREFVWIEDLIVLMEECASSPIWSVLEPEDADFVTRQAFLHPAFVEDVVREAALRLRAHPAITWFSVEAENFESIHNHSAYANIEMADEGNSSR